MWERLLRWILACFAVLGAIFMAALHGARFVMDWTGRTTFADDAEHAKNLGVRLMDWLLQTPWWVPSLLMTALTVAAIAALIWAARSTAQPRQSSVSAMGSAKAERALQDEGAIAAAIAAERREAEPERRRIAADLAGKTARIDALQRELTEERQRIAVLTESARVMTQQMDGAHERAAVLEASHRRLHEEIERRNRETTTTAAAPAVSLGDAIHPPTVTQGPPPTFDPQGLHVGRMSIDASKLEKERHLEIAVFCFNATGVTLDIDRVDGSIGVTVKGQHQFDLPRPYIMSERGGVRGVKHQNEFLVVLGQRVTPELYELMENDPTAVRFELDKLAVLAHEVGHIDSSVRLPLWTAVYLYRSDQLPTGHVVSLAATSKN